MKRYLLTILIILTMLTGCSGDASKTNSDIPKESGEVQENITKPLTEPHDNLSPDEDDKNIEEEYTPPEMEGEISITTMYEEEFLTIAANKFMDKYPNVKIIINVFKNDSDSFLLEEYQNYLNTKIMTGKAEDIIMNRYLPSRKYIDMGALSDLSSFLNNTPEIKSDNFYMNIFEMMKDNKGRMYEIPLGCTLSKIVYFDKALATNSNLFLDDNITTMSFDKVLDYAKQLISNTDMVNTFLNMGRGRNISMDLITNDLNKFIDFENKKVDINTKQYAEILETGKDLEKQGYFDTTRSIDYYNMEYHLAFLDDYDVQAAYYSLIPDSIRYHSMPLSDADGNIYTNPLRAGINSASNNKELAWEFIKYLLSDEVQSLPSFYSLGVNKKGFDAIVDRNLQMYNDGNKQNVSKEEYKNLLESWLSQINAFNSEQVYITNMIYEENIKFFEGKQSAEATAEALQRKIDQYFNE